jgi:hypothetical protein
MKQPMRQLRRVGAGLALFVLAATATAAEKSPPGDIPDNQVFINYQSPLGFAVKVPEGWARRESGTDVAFSDKYNRVHLTVVPRDAAPTQAGIAAEFADLKKTQTGLKLESVQPVKLPSGPALRARYRSLSERSPVTNKAIPLENERYYCWKNGKLAVLTLSAPAGADNADQWQLMSQSFTWR